MVLLVLRLVAVVPFDFVVVVVEVMAETAIIAFASLPRLGRHLDQSLVAAASWALLSLVRARPTLLSEESLCRPRHQHGHQYGHHHPQ